MAPFVPIVTRDDVNQWMSMNIHDLAQEIHNAWMDSDYKKYKESLKRMKAGLNKAESFLKDDLWEEQ